MSRITARSLAVLAAGLVLSGVAACGSTSASSKPPKDELTSSIDALGDSKAMTVTLNLDASAAQLQALAQANGDKLDPRIANLVAGADVKVQLSSPSSKKLKDFRSDDVASPNMSLAADLDGSPVVEIRTVDQVLYLRGDVQKILTLAQQPKVYAELQARAATLPPFVQAAVAGKWVSFPADQAKALAGQLGGTPTATPSAVSSSKYLDALKSVIAKDVAVKRVSTGGDKGDHLQLTASTRTLATDLTNTLSSIVPGAGALSRQVKPSATPDRTVTVDAYVKGGKLSELSFDLAQLATGADAAKVQGQHLPLVLKFDDSAATIDKPSGATQIDMSQILPLVGALSGGSGQ